MEYDLYTTDDIIKKFSISEQTLYNWINKNNFPKSIKIGRRVYWKKETIDNYLRKLEEREQDNYE
jgi:predicted DNA-binding transcriptional regulator AlpA